MIQDVLWEITLWADKALWRSWLIHTVIAVPILLLVGPIATVAYYTIRELEQLSHATMGGYLAPWYDYILDVACPATLALLWFALGFPVLLT